MVRDFMDSNAATESIALDILEQMKDLPGGLLPILQRLQEVQGYLSAELISAVADALNLSSAEVQGVISFYDEFRTSPATTHVVKICRAEACQSVGGRVLESHAKTQLDTNIADVAQVTLVPIYCLGNCARGPSIQIDGTVYGQVTPAHFDELIENLGRQRRSPTVKHSRSTSNAIQIYVPDDTTACAVSADEVAEAILAEARLRNVDIELLRYGSRGMFWLETLVEVDTPSGRVAYGPVQAKDVAGLFDTHFYMGDNYMDNNRGDQNSALSLGLTEEIPYLKKQQRLNFARAGTVDPVSLTSYKEQGGYAGLQRVLGINGLGMTAQAIVDEVKTSGLRGRGGAAFPAGIKWQTVLDAPINKNSPLNTQKKYIVCNADEGDSGTFSDRLLMEADPFQLIEGMTIAALATGATQGYIYLRSEYPKAYQKLKVAIEVAYAENYLGDDIAGSGQAFDLEIRVGAGAYICGEETALLESLEGKRGMVRVKPPLPAIKGLFGQPTVINNVLTLATVSTILAEGADAYKSLGIGSSLGTLPMQLSGNIKRGGLFELAFGSTLRELIEEYGGGTASGRPIKAVQIGGPLGAYLTESQLDIKIDYESFSELGAMLGHGGVVVFDDTVDMSEQARFAMEFCAIESCGKCTPCRIGSTRGIEVIDKICSGDETERSNNLILLHDLCDTMEHGSLCAMGGLTPSPVRSALQHFSEDFGVQPDTNAGEGEC